MAKLTAKEFAEKWSTNLRASIPYIRAGVEKVSVAPSELAVKAKDRMKARLIEAIDKGKWESGLKKYTLDQWKKDMIEKGLDRISSGADKAKPKVEEFANQLLPYIDAGVREIEKLPAVTLEDSIRRATEWIRYMSKFSKK